MLGIRGGGGSPRSVKVWEGEVRSRKKKDRVAGGKLVLLSVGAKSKPREAGRFSHSAASSVVFLRELDIVLPREGFQISCRKTDVVMLK